MGQLGLLGAVEYRARGPDFVDDPVEIFAGNAEGRGLELAARTTNGTVAMTLFASPA
jgi:hypothetical protein